MKKYTLISLLLLLTLHSGIAQFSTGDFSEEYFDSSGFEPTATAIGDFDGDGINDIVIANSGSTNLVVYRNIQTHPELNYEFTLLEVTYPYDIALSDINSDGFLDIITTNLDETFSVFINTSTGSGDIAFALTQSFITYASSYSVLVEDFDGDNKPDVVVSGFDDSIISLYRNLTINGSLTMSFAAGVELLTEANVYGLDAGDMDQDGKLDLVVANTGANSISIFRNNSVIGAFGFTKFNYSTGSGSTPIQVLVDRLNDDGFPDIAVTAYGTNTLKVFTNASSGPGNIILNNITNYATGLNPSDVSAADFDNDGKNDIIVTNSGGENISIFRNNSVSNTISFTLKTNFGIYDGDESSGCSIGDLDNDGRIDIVNAYLNSNVIGAFRNAITYTQIGVVDIGFSSEQLLQLASTGVYRGAVYLQGDTEYYFQANGNSEITWGEDVSGFVKRDGTPFYISETGLYECFFNTIDGSYYLKKATSIGLVGSAITGTNDGWSQDIEMVDQGDGIYTIDFVEFFGGDWKIRLDNNWNGLNWGSINDDGNLDLFTDDNVSSSPKGFYGLRVDLVNNTYSFQFLDGAFSWFPIDTDNTGLIVDIIHSNNATVSGVMLDVDRFGQLNSSYNFDGIDDTATGSDVGFPMGNEARTISGWIKVDTNSDSPIMLLEYGSSSISGVGFGVGYLGISPQLWGNGMDIIASGINYTLGQWHFVAGVFDGSTGYVYFDGEQVAIGDLALNTTSDGTFSIGGSVDNNQFANVSVDDIRVFNKVLSANQIKNLYQENHWAVPSIDDFSIAGELNHHINPFIDLITVMVPANTDLSALTPNITLDSRFTISPNNGVVNNFNQTQTYTVTSSTESREYRVTIVKEGNNSQFKKNKLIGDWSEDASRAYIRVGPDNAPWMSSWYIDPVGANAQSCESDNVFSFLQNEDFIINDQGLTWMTPFQGVNYNCGDPATGNPYNEFVSGTHTYSNTLDKITVNGAGAYIALPNAYNGGEYRSDSIISVKESVTYDIYHYEERNGVAYMTLRIKVSQKVDGNVWYLELKHDLLTANDFTSFNLEGILIDPTIDNNTNTISFELEDGTDRSNLKPIFTLPDGAVATINGSVFTSNSSSFDLSRSLEIKVIAQNGTSKTWTLKVKAGNELPKGVIAYYPLDGDGKDFSGNGFDMIQVDSSVASTTIPTVADQYGKNPGAFNFNNNGDHLRIDLTQEWNSLNEEITVTAWIKPTALPENGTIGDVIVQNGSSVGRLMYDNLGNLFYHWQQDLNTYPQVISNPVVTENTWQMVAYTIDINNNIVLYHNGTKIKEQNGLIINKSDVNFFSIASNDMVDQSDLRYINGAIDNVHIYNVALSPTEIQTNFFDEKIKSIEADILSFTLAGQTAIIDTNNRTIEVEVPNATTVTSLAATFTLSTGAVAKIADIEQISQATLNNYSTNLIYTVIAEDQVTTKNWTVSVTKSPITDFTAPIITLSEIPNNYQIGGNGATIRINIIEESELSNVTINYRGIINGNVNKLNIALSTISNNTTTFVIPNQAFDAQGVEFFVEASDIYNNKGESDVSSISSITPNPPSITGLPTGSETSRYSIISVPYQTTAVATMMANPDASNPDKSKWRLLKHTNGIDYQDFADQSFSFEPGKGYWFLSLTNSSITFNEGTAVKANSSDPFEISLNAGWNLIGNPYLFDLNMSSIINANSIENPWITTALLKGFSNGNYNTQNGIKKYEGVFINAPSAVKLKIPLDNGTSSGRMADKISHNFGQPGKGDWIFGLTLYSDKILTASSDFGMSAGSTDYMDPSDWTALPRISEVHEMLFDNNTIRNLVYPKESQKWMFTVNSNKSGLQSQLTWGNDVLHENSYNLLLHDLTNGQIVDMSSVNSYSFYQKSEQYGFEIYYGLTDKVAHQIDLTKHSIGDPYPNPSTGILDLPISVLGKYGSAEITMYDISGRVHLTSQILLEGGYQKLNLNLTSSTMITSGTYLLKIKVKSNEITETFNKRIVLLR